MKKIRRLFPESKVIYRPSDPMVFGSVPSRLKNAEKEMLLNASINSSQEIFRKSITIDVDVYVKDKESLKVGDMELHFIATPGHTKGGVCYLIGDKLFSGDTIFYGSVGRTDLPGGSYEQIVKSVKNLLETLDEKVEIYTGHGSNTNVAYEKKFNPVM